MRPLGLLAMAALVSTTGGCATWFGDRPPARVQAGVLVDSRGMTLYTFDRDLPGVGRSACLDSCARVWPPFVAPASARSVRDFGILQRADGRAQWSYRGKPLYLWSGEKSAGERGGHGSDNLWRAAAP